MRRECSSASTASSGTSGLCGVEAADCAFQPEEMPRPQPGAIFSPKGWPFIAGGPASLRARPPDIALQTNQTPKGSTRLSSLPARPALQAAGARRRLVWVAAFRGCRRKAPSTPRLRTVKTFGLKSEHRPSVWTICSSIESLPISPNGYLRERRRLRCGSLNSPHHSSGVHHADHRCWRIVYV